jgi:type II secretory pathway component PulJ
MPRNNQMGFTLAEILIVLAASAIVGTILISILIQGSSLFSHQSTKVSQNLSLNSTSNQISQSIQFASSIASNYTNGGFSYTTSNKTLIAKIPSLDSSGNVIENKFDTLIIMPDPIKNNQLKKILFVDPLSYRKSENSVITTNLSYLEFIYLNDNGIQTSPQTATRVDFIVKVAEKAGQTVQESSVSGRINLKNI